jgi:hypothetical protein
LGRGTRPAWSRLTGDQWDRTGICVPGDHGQSGRRSNAFFSIARMKSDFASV